MELFALFFLGLPLAYIAFQIRALTRWDGTFKMAAGLPVLAWALWGFVFAIDVTRDPTSHNLFPFEILIGAILASGYLCVLAIFRRIIS
jgi:hypothetical protein